MFASFRTAVLATASLVSATSALAIDLTVTHFGSGMYGVPFAIAREKGWFKSDAGLDVTGFITSPWPPTFRMARWRCRQRSRRSSRG
jgi:ABC-type nitrate/sulfonate/bicarbonate transport system substrate-binding protein